MIEMFLTFKLLTPTTVIVDEHIHTRILIFHFFTARKWFAPELKTHRQQFSPTALLCCDH